MKEKVKIWLEGEKRQIEDLIARSCFYEYLNRKNDSEFNYDIVANENEFWNLSRDGDYYYDRPSTGLAYAQRYLGRRINTAIDIALMVIEEAILKKEPLSILDLGAGTGAVQTAFAICAEGFSKIGQKPPQMEFVNVDISPFMLEFSRDQLWNQVNKFYKVSNSIQTSYFVNSWSNAHLEKTSNKPKLIASYLFDHTEDKKSLSFYLNRIIEAISPGEIFLLTSIRKRQFVDFLSEEVGNKQGYESSYISTGNTFKGQISRVIEFRNFVNREMEEMGKPIVFYGKPPVWDEKSLVRLRLKKITKGTAEQTLGLEENPKIEIFSAPLKVRSEISLTKEQKEAAELKDRPTIIVGPAGSGKSVVITEKILKICHKNLHNKDFKILLTTFNKRLLNELSIWLESLFKEKIGRNTIRKDGRNFYFPNSFEPNIRLMHFDILPTQIGGLVGNLWFDTQNREVISECIEEFLEKPTKLSKEIHGSDILDPSFLLNEYERIIYGLEINNLLEYQEVVRKGRPKRLDHYSAKREAIWEILKLFEERLSASSSDTIHTRRKKFLSNLEAGNNREIFDYIIIDEFQDCTQTDYKIFYALAKNLNRIVLAGDYAQAVQIGNNSAPPKRGSVNREMGNFETHYLKGSFRLPYRISECLIPLSEKIKTGNEETTLLLPYKGAPPGARPILVAGRNKQELARKITTIITKYKSYDIVDWEHPHDRKATILESDRELASQINYFHNGIAETESILRIKGLEKRCIIWASYVEIFDKEDVNHYIYTILTRTSGILIIAILENQILEQLVDILQILPKHLLIYWDYPTQKKVNQILKENNGS